MHGLCSLSGVTTVTSVTSQTQDCSCGRTGLSLLMSINVPLVHPCLMACTAQRNLKGPGSDRINVDVVPKLVSRCLDRLRQKTSCCTLSAMREGPVHRAKDNRWSNSKVARAFWQESWALTPGTRELVSRDILNHGEIAKHARENSNPDYELFDVVMNRAEQRNGRQRILQEKQKKRAAAWRCSGVRKRGWLPGCLSHFAPSGEQRPDCSWGG